MRKVTIIGLLFAVILTGAGCGKRQIDTEEAGGFPIAGTSYYGFCRGTTLMMWVPSTGADEIDVVHYNDPECSPTDSDVQQGPRVDDPDGTVGEDD